VQSTNKFSLIAVQCWAEFYYFSHAMFVVGEKASLKERFTMNFLNGTVFSKIQAERLLLQARK